MIYDDSELWEWEGKVDKNYILLYFMFCSNFYYIDLTSEQMIFKSKLMKMILNLSVKNFIPWKSLYLYPPGGGGCEKWNVLDKHKQLILLWMVWWFKFKFFFWVRTLPENSKLTYYYKIIKENLYLHLVYLAKNQSLCVMYHVYEFCFHWTNF